MAAPRRLLDLASCSCFWKRRSKDILSPHVIQTAPVGRMEKNIGGSRASIKGTTNKSCPYLPSKRNGLSI
jgi:hypothetical protein